MNKYKPGDLVIYTNQKHICIIDKVTKEGVYCKNFYNPDYKFNRMDKFEEIRYATEEEIAFCVALKLKGDT